MMKLAKIGKKWRFFFRTRVRSTASANAQTSLSQQPLNQFAQFFLMERSWKAASIDNQLKQISQQTLTML